VLAAGPEIQLDLPGGDLQEFQWLPGAVRRTPVGEARFTGLLRAGPFALHRP
jgi:hypothetical protein